LTIVASQAAKAGVKAAGVVIDDTAVTPSYVIGFSAKRELPIRKDRGWITSQRAAFGAKGGAPHKRSAARAVAGRPKSTRSPKSSVDSTH
jgi:hypothetical protein